MKYFLCGSVLLSVAYTAGANTIIDSTTSENGYSLAITNGQTLLGNTLYVSPDWLMTSFSFVYYGSGAAANHNLGVELSFYEANGPLTFGTYGNPTPGTLLYNSGWYFNSDGTELPDGRNTIQYTGSDFGSFTNQYLPSSFVFTITFTNLGSSIIDLPLADNQTTVAAKDYGAYWVYNSGNSTWSLMTNSAAVPANLVTTVEGVPEPSMIAMGIFGGTLLAAAGILRRRD